MQKNLSILRLFIVIFTLLLSFNSFSQGEANNWYFGQNAGISFNTSPPSVLTDGQLTTNEGCSSISAPNGNLLFYTDGRTIWDANHQIMPNADYFGGSGLNGDPSSTSSGLIVPHPTQENLYYVFSVDEPHHDNAFAYPNQGPANPDGTPSSNYSDVISHTVPQDDDGFNNGFTYSVVDMNLNNGLGDVVPIEKNIELQTYDPNDPEEIKYKCAEKITAVRAQNCNSIWVITHFKDTFYSFLIDDNGINTTPVTSQVGPLVPTDAYRRAAIGYLKASPDGDKLLTANQTMDYDAVNNNDFGTGNVYLFDFDSTTGQVTNPLELINNVNAYSVEFSADGTKAYANVRVEGVDELHQWDLESNDIPSSIFTFSISNSTGGALQLAPNGKIYRSIVGGSTLAVINEPNALGVAANYSENTANGAIYLGGNSSIFGLPPFIQSLFSTRIDIVGDGTQQVDLCDGESFTLSYEDIANADYIWKKDGEVLTNQTTSTLLISQPFGVNLPYQETYTLETDLNDGSCPKIGVANVTYFPNPQVNTVELNECLKDFDQNSSEFNLTEANAQMLSNQANVDDYNFSFFESLEDAQINVNPIENIQAYENTSTPQTLHVIVENNTSGCSSLTELTLNIIEIEINNFSLQRCDDEQNGIQTFDLNEIESQENLSVGGFYLTENDALSETNPLSNPNSFEIENQFFQDVFFTIDNGTPCKDLGILTLEVVELPVLVDDLTYYCVEDFPNPITISAAIPENVIDNFEFLWISSEETTPEIQVNEAGTYEVAITYLETGCTNFRNIEVVESGLANFSLEIEEFLRDENTVTVLVSPESLGDYEFALNNPLGPYQDSNVFENVLPGIYDIFVRDKNGCGVKQKTFGILGIMEYFTPNGDGINDVWEFKGVFNNKQALAYVYIFDRYGKLLKSFRGLDKFWDGIYNDKPMPSQDYWYKIKLDNDRVLSGHFTLKR